MQNPLYPEFESEDCEMCKGLRADHAEIAGDVSGEKLMKKHFPNNVLIKPQHKKETKH